MRHNGLYITHNISKYHQNRRMGVGDTSISVQGLFLTSWGYRAVTHLDQSDVQIDPLDPLNITVEYVLGAVRGYCLAAIAMP